MLLLTSDCSGHLVTARASDSMFCIDFVRVTNCFYDYDYDYAIRELILPDQSFIILFYELSAYYAVMAFEV